MLHFQSPLPTQNSTRTTAPPTAHTSIHAAWTKAYHPVLIQFMSYRDDEEYERDNEFTPEELNEIQPEEIEKWMRVKVGSLSQDRMTILHWVEHHRLSTTRRLYLTTCPTSSFWMKSDFQDREPYKIYSGKWTNQESEKKEAWKQGKRSSARRPFEPAEFEQTLDMCNDLDGKYVHDSSFLLQVPVYNGCKSGWFLPAWKAGLFVCLKPNPQFPFTLLCWMFCFKNVLEERDAPDQILLGAMDRCYCVLLGLGIFLEVWCEAEVGIANPYLFGDTGDPKKTKKSVYETLKRYVWAKPE